MPKYNFKKAFNGKTNRSYAKQIGQGLASKAIMRRQIGRGLKYVKQQFGGMQPMSSGMISGHGDYKVHKKGYTVGRGFGHSRKHPHVHLEKGAMTIHHTEYIGDLVSGTTNPSAFVSQSYGINPGNMGTFPWLSGTAINFQEYKFHKLVFEYRPLVSESSSTTSGSLLSMGSVILGTQYNSSVGPYPNKATMAEADYSVTTKPSEHLLHAVECDVKYNPMGILYTSAQTSLTVGSNGTDIRMQNLGIFQAASVGIPTAATTSVGLGELWVHYSVTLYKPQLNAGLSALESAHYYGQADDGNPTNGNPFGPNITAANQPLAIPGNLLSLTFTTNSFTFPLAVTTGNFLCVYYARGGAASVAWSNPTANAQCTILQVFNNGTLGSTNQVTTAGAPITGTAQAVTALFCQAFVVQVNAPGALLATVTLNIATSVVTGQYDLLVTPYNSVML